MIVLVIKVAHMGQDSMNIGLSYGLVLEQMAKALPLELCTRQRKKAPRTTICCGTEKKVTTRQ
jgi:hypothetical protein